MTDWHIRVAVAADAEPLERCMHAAYQPYQARLGGESLPPLEADYAAELRDFPCWVAVSDSTIVGGLFMAFETDHAIIANVAVDPEFHGLGIGGSLLQQAQSAAQAKGIRQLRLTTHRRLHENLSLYHHLGWRESARDGNRIFLHKTIPPSTA